MTGHGFDVQAVRDVRDEAISRVEAPAAPWVAVALDTLRRLAVRHATLTSDDVWAELDREGVPRPGEGRAMGAVMKRAMKEGLIVPAGFTQGTDPKHHGDVMRVYRTVVEA